MKEGIISKFKKGYNEKFTNCASCGEKVLKKYGCICPRCKKRMGRFMN